MLCHVFQWLALLLRLELATFSSSNFVKASRLDSSVEAAAAASSCDPRALDATGGASARMD